MRPASQRPGHVFDAIGAVGVGANDVRRRRSRTRGFTIFMAVRIAWSSALRLVKLTTAVPPGARWSAMKRQFDASSAGPGKSSRQVNR